MVKVANVSLDGYDELHTKRKSYARIPSVLPLPNLIQVQLDSYKWFVETGLRNLFDEISPIVSFNKMLELHFPGYNEEIPCMLRSYSITVRRTSRWCKRFTWATSR